MNRFEAGEGVEEMSPAEAERARQSEVLRTIFDHIPVMIGLIGRDGRVEVVNRLWEEVTGWSQEGARDRDAGAELYPDSDERRRVVDFIRNTPRGLERLPDPRPLGPDDRHLLGERGPLRRHGDRHRPGRQRPGKRVDEALRRSELRFRAVFEGECSTRWSLADDDGLYVDANPAACDLFGLPRELLIGRRVSDFTCSGPRLRRRLGRLPPRGADAAFCICRPDGSARETEFAATADVVPGLHLSVLRDVTERVRAEEARRDSERRVVAILESITDAFVAVDRDWRLVYVNRQAEPFLKKRREDLLGRDLWDEFPNTLSTLFSRSEIRRAAVEEVAVSFEAPAPTAPDRWYRVHTYPSADGLSIYFADVSKLKRADEALRASERRFRDVLENSRDAVYRLNLATAASTTSARRPPPSSTCRRRLWRPSTCRRSWRGSIPTTSPSSGRTSTASRPPAARPRRRPSSIACSVRTPAGAG